MGWPHYTLLGIWLVGLGAAIAKHGEPIEGKYNVFHVLFRLSIFCTLLYFAGFFE